MTYKVMLVDDEYMILEGLKHIIEWQKFGFQIVKTAQNADDALAYLKTHVIDLLILDVNMPELTGIEMLKSLKKIDFQVLILSGYQEFDYVKQVMALGVKRYLTKPVDAVELEHSVIEVKKQLEKRFETVEKQRETALWQLLQGQLTDEVAQLVSEKSFQTASTYTVLLLQEMGCNSIKSSRNFMMLQTNNVNILLFFGDRIELQIYLKTLTASSIFVGSTVTDWQDIQTSYQSAQLAKESADFYQDGTRAYVMQKHNVTDSGTAEQPSLVAFNQALTNRDMTVLMTEIDLILQQIQMIRMAPKNVRYLVEILSSDIYRSYSYLDKTIYEQKLENVRSARTLSDIKLFFEHFLSEMRHHQVSDKKYSDTIYRVVTYIEDNIKSELSLKSIAEAFYMNPVYLGHLFKTETGMNFSRYINHLRMLMAESLLIHSRQSINEISEAVGYNNTNYFSKIFKHAHQITPKEFREQKRK